MTLFIAFILIYHFEMNGWFYIAAIGIYIAHVFHEYLMTDNLNSSLKRIQDSVNGLYPRS